MSDMDPLTPADKAHNVLIEALQDLRKAAIFDAAEGDLKTAAELTAVALQVAMATLMEAAEYLPEERRGEYLPALGQLHAEVKNLLYQTSKLEPK